MYIMGNHARQLLEDTSQIPKVHSVFRNAVNIGCGDDYLVTILPEPLGIGPLAITLSIEDYNVLKRKIGTEGSDFCADIFKDFGDERVECFKLPERLEGLCVDNVDHNLGICRQQFTNSDMGDSGYALCRPVFSAAGEAIRSSIRKRDYHRLAEGASSIIGLGPGLTPSADDFLYGLFAALFYKCRYRNYDIDWLKSALKLIIPCCRHRTTIISYNMLRTCLDAEFNGHIIGLLTHVFCGTEKEVRESCSQVLAIGSSSGISMLAGVVFGLEALI